MNISNNDKVYHNSDHLTYSCQYHVVFCPKYRRKILTHPYDEELKRIILQVAEKYNFKIIEMEVMPDHVHLIIDCNPRFDIMECVKKIKGTSANILRKNFPELKSRIPTLWTRASFISTVGSVSLEVVKKYIEEQKKV